MPPESCSDETKPAEFFAVATECIFEKARPLRQKHPELYDELERFYQRDPAERLAANFFAQVRSAYQLAVWTSAMASHAAPIARSIFPPDLPQAFVWSRERCTWRRNPETQEEYWLKNLRKVKRLGYDLDRVLMVDDEAHKLEWNYGNHIGSDAF